MSADVLPFDRYRIAGPHSRAATHGRRMRTALRRFVLAGLWAVSLPAAAQHAADIDPTLAPRPAVMAPRAATSLLLDIARAGEHWIVVGQRGVILRSSDGQHWQQMPSPVDVMLTRVRFFDDTRGWALGYDGAVLETRDGGRSWTLLRFDPQWGKPWFDVLFLDAEHILLAGTNGALMITADGGQTWQSIDTPALEDGPNLYSLAALGDGSLLLAGERGFLARSTDRGATWQRLRSPYSGSYFGALPVGEQGVVIFGLRGHAFYAADLRAAEVLSAEAAQALREAALDPTAAAAHINPVSEVSGWTRLENDDYESLFGGTVTADGRVLLFGMNGHVMQVDLTSRRLHRLPAAPESNLNAGRLAGSDLIVVGTAGVQRLPLTR